MKPDKNVEAPPLRKYYEYFGGCLFKHKFEWKISEMGQYKQEVCKKCGVTGQTEKL